MRKDIVTNERQMKKERKNIKNHKRGTRQMKSTKDNKMIK
jgi:hypothetical protein